MMRRGQAWILAALAGLFAIGRIVILLHSKVFTSYDSFSYAYRNDPAWDRGALVSLTGHAPRPWGVPIFFVLFPDDHSRAVAQWTVGTVAWAFLAWSLYLSLQRPAARLTAFGGILLFGLMRPVASWDFAILSESLTISLGVLVLGFLLWWIRTRSLWSLAAMVLVGVWWMFTRVDVFVMALPIVAALAWYTWRQRKNARVRNAALAGALVLAFAAGWSYLVVGPTSMQTHRQWSFDPNLTHERGLLVYRLRISVFADPAVKAVFEGELGMPKCPGADRIAAGGDWAIEEFDAEIRQCPELQAWTEKNLHGLWSKYATTAPVLFTRQIGQFTSDALTGAAYAETPSVIPTALEKAAFPRKHTLLITLAFLALSAAAAFAFGGWRQHNALLITGAVLAATALASAVLTVVVSSGEVWRFGIQEAIAIRIAILMLVCIALDRRLTSKR